LRRIGRVLHLTPGGMLIVRAEKTPNLGETVVDDNLKQVGTVFDIFGPISSPYISVKPTTSDPATLLGKTLYAVSRREGRSWRRRS